MIDVFEISLLPESPISGMDSLHIRLVDGGYEIRIEDRAVWLTEKTAFQLFKELGDRVNEKGGSNG